MILAKFTACLIVLSICSAATIPLKRSPSIPTEGTIIVDQNPYIMFVNIGDQTIPAGIILYSETSLFSNCSLFKSFECVESDYCYVDMNIHKEASHAYYTFDGFQLTSNIVIPGGGWGNRAAKAIYATKCDGDYLKNDCKAMIGLGASGPNFFDTDRFSISIMSAVDGQLSFGEDVDEGDSSTAIQIGDDLVSLNWEISLNEFSLGNRSDTASSYSGNIIFVLALYHIAVPVKVFEHLITWFNYYEVYCITNSSFHTICRYNGDPLNLPNISLQASSSAHINISSDIYFKKIDGGQYLLNIIRTCNNLTTDGLLYVTEKYTDTIILGVPFLKAYEEIVFDFHDPRKPSITLYKNSRQSANMELILLMIIATFGVLLCAFLYWKTGKPQQKQVPPEESLFDETSNLQKNLLSGFGPASKHEEQPGSIDHIAEEGLMDQSPTVRHLVDSLGKNEDKRLDDFSLVVNEQSNPLGPRKLSNPQFLNNIDNEATPKSMGVSGRFKNQVTSLNDPLGKASITGGF